MDKPFKTSDLGHAAYLVYKGVNLLGCTPSEEKGRLLFVFIDQPEREAYTEEWVTGTGDAKVAKQFNFKLRLCKKTLNDPVGR